VTGVAKLPAGMFLSVYLRKALGFGPVFGVTAYAKLSDVWLLWGEAGGVIGVFCERAVTGFAVHMGVPAFGFGIGHVRVTSFAGFMASVRDGTRGNFGDGVATVMAVAPETFGDESTAEDQEQDQAEEENGGHAKQVGDVLKLDHSDL